LKNITEEKGEKCLAGGGRGGEKKPAGTFM
jgi:hypothetical protein